MLIVYNGPDEVLITTPEQEPTMIQEWITEGERDMDDYDRIAVPTDVVLVKARMVIYE